MTYFVKDEVDRIEIDKEHWVDIKHQMNTYDCQLLQVSYMVPDVEKGTLKLVGRAELAENEISLLLINIKEWNLPSGKKEGEIMPITRETIKKLQPKISTKIAVEIGKRNPVPKA